MSFIYFIQTAAIDFLQSYGQELKIIATTLFGSAGMYVFSSFKGFDNSINFLKRMVPGRSDTFYYRYDLIVMTISGTIIGLITFSPNGIYQALAAGFGWAGAMNGLLKTEPPRNAGV
jgi:hypothetical protein